MAQVKATHLQANGMQVNMSDSDTLRQALRPSSDDDVSNKVYTDESDLAVTIAAQDANDVLEERIDADLSNLNTALTGEILARQTADQEIIDLIESGGPDGSNTYVQRSGDNMTGDLTLGTDKITLDATSGAGTFADRITAPNFYPGIDHFYLTASYQQTGVGTTVGAGLLRLNDPDSTQGAQQAFRITQGGNQPNDATIAFMYDGNASFDGGVNADSVTTNDLSVNGSATISGSIEAASIDGGTY